jgi:predicted XRE-type DNA-binding protein
VKRINIYFDKNIKTLIDNSNYSLKEISLKLKIPLSSLEKILDGKLEGFSIVSLKDIANRLSHLLNEEIHVICEDDETVKPNQKVNKRFFNKAISFKLIISIFFIINLVFLYFIVKDLKFYRDVLYKNLYSLTISNHASTEILVNEIELAPQDSIKMELTPGQNIKITGNKNNENIVITTPNAIYNINLENFEVILSNGKS